MRTLVIPAMVVLVAASGLGAPAEGAKEPSSTSFAPSLATLITGLEPDAAIGVIVETDGPPTPVAARARAAGFDVVWTYDIIDGFSARATAGDLTRLAALPGVARVWEDRPVTALMDNSAKDIQATLAWAAGYNGLGITVAVLDTGIEPLDAAFAGAVVRCVSTIGGLVSPECTDTDGHGTHVAGTVASRDATYRGIAWGASLAVVRVLHAGGAGLNSDIIAGMNWVRNNQNLVSPPIRVATMSIGPLNPGCGNGQSPDAVAADNLVASGVSFTIAAGNSGHNTCTVDGAGAAFNVVTVGAVDDRNTPSPLDDTLASFSSGGPTADGRLKPEISAPGVNIKSVYLGPTIAELDGTSMATPHVAGTIAVLLQKEPGFTPAQVKSRLTSNAVKPTLAPAMPNNDWGYGVVNVCKALQLVGCA